MIGVVVVTHGQLANELVNAALELVPQINIHTGLSVGFLFPCHALGRPVHRTARHVSGFLVMSSEAETSLIFSNK